MKPVYVFIENVRALLVKYAIGTIASLKMPDYRNSDFWTEISEPHYL
jgi:hypothetical protein